MRIIIAGSRDFDDYELLERTMNRLTLRVDNITVLSGGAKGADTLGEQWALCNMFPVERYHPDWTKHGKKAGPIRNDEMAKAVGPKGKCVVFYDGSSPGSTNMIETAKAYGLKLKVIYYKEMLKPADGCVENPST